MMSEHNARLSALRGVLAADVNLQRGYATVESAGRLQLRVDELPASLQPTEWQGIPRALQKDLSAASANFAYRLVEPDFQLPLKIERHEAAWRPQPHIRISGFVPACHFPDADLSGHKDIG